MSTTHVCSGLIEHQHLGRVQESARQRQQLLLACAEGGAPFLEEGIEARWPGLDHSSKVGPVETITWHLIVSQLLLLAHTVPQLPRIL